MMFLSSMAVQTEKIWPRNAILRKTAMREMRPLKSKTISGDQWGKP